LLYASDIAMFQRMAVSTSWLLLIHQLPPRPLYLRAQVRRRLAQVGAMPLKNSVYVLPGTAGCLEDLQWIAQEAIAGGGEAVVCRAEFVGTPTDNELRTRFLDDATGRFTPVKEALAEHLKVQRRRKHASPPGPEVLRLQRMVDAAAKTDFFGAEAGVEVQTLMTAIRNMLKTSTSNRTAGGYSDADLKGRVWVTRRDPHIDRLATAWLIRRFVDPAARFRFVDAAGGTVVKGERSFDMVGADFTHEGDRCSFETMSARLSLEDPALAQLAEIVHDLDLKDGKFGRPDAAGVQRLVDGLCAAHADSGARVQAALPIFDTLFASFGGRKLEARSPKRRIRTNRNRGRRGR
jgi:hypothetical protein